jgi:hypothetical protein
MRGFSGRTLLEALNATRAWAWLLRPLYLIARLHPDRSNLQEQQRGMQGHVSRQHGSETNQWTAPPAPPSNS